MDDGGHGKVQGGGVGIQVHFQAGPLRKVGACLCVPVCVTASSLSSPQGAIEGQPALGETEALFDTSREWYNFW